MSDTRGRARPARTHTPGTCTTRGKTAPVPARLGIVNFVTALDAKRIEGKCFASYPHKHACFVIEISARFFQHGCGAYPELTLASRAAARARAPAHGDACGSAECASSRCLRSWSPPADFSVAAAAMAAGSSSTVRSMDKGLDKAGPAVLRRGAGGRDQAGAVGDKARNGKERLQHLSGREP